MKKDKLWAKLKIRKELESWQNIEGSIDKDGIKYVLNIIDQLDEPEVLSQEWIDEHAEHHEYIGFKGVPVDDLQNLIVPKQELPVIPQFVANYIDKSREEAYSLFGAFDKMPTEVASWLIYSKSEGKSEGQDTFARAWLDGYEVEEEPLYYVIDEARRPLLKVFKNKVSMTICNLTVEEIEALKHPNLKYRLTEKQIKNYDECYWAFAVPVEVAE